MAELAVRRLGIGDTFRVNLGPHGHIDYRLLFKNDCRAYVKPLERKTRQIKSAEGVLAEFEKPGDPINISPETQVTLLEKQMDEDLIGGDEFDDLIGDAPARPKVAVAPRASAKNGKPAAAKLLKSCKPETKRGRLLALMVAGEQRFSALEKKMEMKRNEIITYCSEMNRDYGIGYTVGENLVTIHLPIGCESPFTAAPDDDLI